VFTKLRPAAGELVALLASLRELLRSPVPATIAFATKYLTAVDKAGALDDEEYLANCAPAMAVPAKTAPIAAIDLAGKVVTRRPDLATPVRDAVAHGLAHPHRDVQSRALAVLRALDARDVVAAQLDLLEPSVRQAAAEWLGVVKAQAPPAPEAAHPEPHERAPIDLTIAELAATLLAGNIDPWDIEQFLARLVATTAVADELAPVRKQARSVYGAERHSRSLRYSIAAVVLMALGERDEPRDRHSAPMPSGASPFLRGHLLVNRLAEVSNVLSGRQQGGQLLATPTDPAGWLDPRTLVARFAATARFEAAPAHHDLVAALLRLATDGRDEALAAATHLPGEAGAALRYALGGVPAKVETPALWVAAARARAPFDDDPVLIDAGLDGAGQGRAAKYALELIPNVNRYDDGSGGRVRTFTWWTAALTVDPVSVREAPDQPTVLAPRKFKSPGSDVTPDWLPWLATVWPHDAEPFFAATFGDVLFASGVNAEVTYGTAAILDTLVAHPGRLGPVATATLAAGLSTRELAHRTRAVEAFTALVPGNRIPAAQLVDAMASLAGHCTATRWAATLRDVAAVGPAAALSVVDVLARLLPRLPYDHQALHALVSALHEESLRINAMPSGEPLTSWLAGFTGSSTGAKAAKRLLAAVR
jgi:hypothetical protein